MKDTLKIHKRYTKDTFCRHLVLFCEAKRAGLVYERYAFENVALEYRLCTVSVPLMYL